MPLIAALTAPLVAAPYLGLLEVVGSELRVYVSYKTAGLIGDSGPGLVAHVEALSDLMADLVSVLDNPLRPDQGFATMLENGTMGPGALPRTEAGRNR